MQSLLCLKCFVALGIPLNKLIWYSAQSQILGVSDAEQSLIRFSIIRSFIEQRHLYVYRVNATKHERSEYNWLIPNQNTILNFVCIIFRQYTWHFIGLIWHGKGTEVNLLYIVKYIFLGGQTTRKIAICHIMSLCVAASVWGFLGEWLYVMLRNKMLLITKSPNRL